MDFPKIKQICKEIVVIGGKGIDQGMKLAEAIKVKIGNVTEVFYDA